jgi:hypothetical protein
MEEKPAYGASGTANSQSAMTRAAGSSVGPARQWRNSQNLWIGVSRDLLITS